MPAHLGSVYAVRVAKPADIPGVARLAAELVRYHHALDPSRFLLVEPIVQGYTRFLGSEMKNPNVVILAAIRSSAATPATGEGAAEERRATEDIVAYAYGRIEPRDWNMLLEAHGALHDVLVAKEARKEGLGEALVKEMCDRLEALGAPRVVLHTAVQNEGAQALFEKVGFRRTMIEMTRDAKRRG
jgi:ribosomal protein S18 acetylase RimI-like enzyme